MTKKRLLLPGLTLLFIGFYFIALTKDAVLCYFSPDDCMNLYRSWAHPVGTLWKANLLFFLNSPFYRPMGSVWYRTMFDIAGFNPVPFHISNLLILAANIWLTYCVARRLSGSRETGALAALLISYHGSFIPLYFDTGYIYDVVCYFFYFSTLLFYIKIRSRPRSPTWWELVVLSALYICALNAKEMALTLPGILAVYEWFYRRESLGSFRNLGRWAITDGRGVLVTGLLALAVAIGRATTGEGYLANPVFQPVFSWGRFMETSRNFVSQLLLWHGELPGAVVLLIWLSLFVIAWASKSRVLKFAWLFLMLTTIPVAFIQPRGAAQYYVTLFGWVLYAAVALVEGTKYLLGNLPGQEKFAPARPVALFLVTAALMYFVNKPHTWTEVSTVAMEGEELRSMVDQVHHLRPTMPRAARILFLNDPINDRWRVLTLMRLSYRNDDLTVDQVRFMKTPPTASEIASYKSVFDYRNGHFYTATQAHSGPQPEVVYENGQPDLFHSDWTRVTVQRPAQRGEEVMSMMADLGDTTPPLPHGKSFPGYPFLKVASQVDVRIDGQSAEVTRKFGWPDEVNKYRVDFRIPMKVRPGQRDVMVTCGSDSGLPTPIALR